MKEIFGGTVVGYVTDDGKELTGPLPQECRNDGFGHFDWRKAERTPECSAYDNVTGALFRVDVAIVGPTPGALATYGMTWGDGDCNTDFTVGEKWLIAGPYVIEELTAPIREDEVVTLRRLAARPAFDMGQLYR